MESARLAHSPFPFGLSRNFAGIASHEFLMQRVKGTICPFALSASVKIQLAPLLSVTSSEFEEGRVGPPKLMKFNFSFRTPCRHFFTAIKTEPTEGKAQIFSFGSFDTQ